MAYLRLQVWSAFVAFVSVGVYALTDGFAEEPSNRTVTAGSTVTLPCVIDTAGVSAHYFMYVYWYKSFGFSDTPSTPISSYRTILSNVIVGDGRYSIVGSGPRYDLRIADVEVADTSYYMCRYYAGAYLDSQIARLNVYDESLVPQCRFRPANPVIGSTVHLRCSPGSSVTATGLSLWRGANGHQLTSVNRQSDGSIVYQFRLRENDNNRSYTCTHGSDFDNIHNCSVTPFSVKPTISLTPSVNYGLLDRDIRFSCSARGLPKFTSYRWVVGSSANALKLSESIGRYIVSSTNGDSAMLTILGLRASDNNTAVRCTAVNDLGRRQTALGKVIVRSVPNVPSEEATAPDVFVTSDPDIAKRSDTVPGKGISPSGGRRAATDSGLGVSATVLNFEPLGETTESPEEEGILVKSSLNNIPNYKPNAALPILVTCLFLLLIIVIILAILIKKTDKRSPSILKRVSSPPRKPPVPERTSSVSRPRFLERAAESWQGAKRKVADLQRRATFSSREPAEVEEKRTSLRDHYIEVVVNPPPPEWKLKVKDVDKAQRQMLLSHHSPEGGFSEKEKDLLNSLMTGDVQVKSLEKVIRGSAIAQGHDGDIESRLGSGSEKGEFEEPSESEKPMGGRPQASARGDEAKVDSPNAQTESKPHFEPTEAIYANTGVATSTGCAQEGGELVDDASQSDNSTGVNYAQLDLNLTGPWNEKKITQSESSTTYAVIDHTKKNPVVRTICE